MNHSSFAQQDRLMSPIAYDRNEALFLTPNEAGIRRHRIKSLAARLAMPEAHSAARGNLVGSRIVLTTRVVNQAREALPLVDLELEEVGCCCRRTCSLTAARLPRSRRRRGP